jgi:hypothetical protein
VSEGGNQRPCQPQLAVPSGSAQMIGQTRAAFQVPTAPGKRAKDGGLRLEIWLAARSAALDGCTFTASWFVSSSRAQARKEAERANEMVDPETRVKAISPIFRGDGGGSSSLRRVFRFPLEGTQTVGKPPNVPRLSQAMKGRFPGCAPNSSVSPQNRSKFGPMYHLSPGLVPVHGHDARTVRTHPYVLCSFCP